MFLTQAKDVLITLGIGLVSISAEFKGESTNPDVDTEDFPPGYSRLRNSTKTTNFRAQLRGISAAVLGFLPSQSLFPALTSQIIRKSLQSAYWQHDIVS